MNLACGQEKLLQSSKIVHERMAATLTLSRAPGISRNSDVSEDSSAAASTPSGGYWPMISRTVMGRRLAASSLRPARRAARKRAPGARNQIVHRQQECIGMTQANLTLGGSCTRRRPERAARAAVLAVGIAVA